MKLNKILHIIFGFLAINSYAIGTYTTIESGVTLYSEYYPNPKVKFKGTIVFENGSGTDITEWTQNQTFLNCVRQAGPIFLYDRNGLGKSPPDLHVSYKNPITAKFMSKKLFKLLKQRHIKPPYLIVAHSYGAIYVGYFTLTTPNLVKGLLLVDPVPKDFHFSDKLVSSHQSAIIAAKTQSAADVYKKFAQEAEVAYQFLGFAEAKQQVAKLGNINNNIPVIIISSTDMENKVKPIQEDWYTSQKQWLNKNTMSKIFTESSGHFIQLEKPDLVCNQIKDLLK